jgi:septum formation topological specificity factor MinE
MECRGTCNRLAGGVFLVLALAAMVLVGSAQDGTKPADALGGSSSAGGASATDELTLEQSRVSDRYARLEELMFKMASLEEATNPKRAALLRRAIEQSKERLTKTELEAVVKLLSQKQLKRALDGQVAVQGDLKALLELLQSEDRADRLKSEQERIKEYIKEVDRLIRLQKSLQGQTEGGLDAKKLSDEQGKLATRTGDLAQKIKENEEGKPSEGENKKEEQPEGQKSEGQESEGQKSEGQKSEGQKSEGQKSEKGDGQKSEGQKSEKSDGQKSEGQKSEKSDGQKSEGQKSEGQKSEGQKSEGQKSEGQKSEGQKSEGQQNQGQQNQGQQQDQQQQDQQQRQDNPARQRIEQAEQKMKDAQKRLEEAKRNESVEDQRKAREELEKAKAELEEILRQMRQEEVARTLADLEARFRRMLEAQLKVYESTRRLDQRPETDRGETFIVQAGKLSSDERNIANEAQRALSLLIEEGSSVAFPATVEQMHEDMLAVVNRLAEVKVDDITIGYEEDIIAALEELILALQKAQQDLEQQQQQQQQQEQQQQQDQPLVDELAELKMIKSLQERVNKRTVRFARLLDDDQDAVGQAEAAELVDALQKLSDRQQEIFRITRDLVLGKNQ